MDAIKQIQLTKKYLQLSAVEVKSGVHSTMSHLLESLRSREVWLLEQADVVLQAKDAVLRAQEDRLHQVLGALTSRLQLLRTDAMPAHEELNDLLERMSELETRPLETPHICFRADSVSLREAILGFGRIDSKGLPLDAFVGGGEGGDEGGARSLPRPFEDYGDDEHQVLYKPIGASSLTPGLDSSMIVFNIPQLPALKQFKSFGVPTVASPAPAPAVTGGPPPGPAPLAVSGAAAGGQGAPRARVEGRVSIDVKQHSPVAE
jgi:hypothetical protein